MILLSMDLIGMIENLLLCRARAKQVRKYSMLLILTGGNIEMPWIAMVSGWCFSAKT